MTKKQKRTAPAGAAGDMVQEMTYGEIDAAYSALMTLKTYRFPFPTLLALLPYVREMTTKRAAYGAEHDAIVEVFAARDEAGELVPGDVPGSIQLTDSLAFDKAVSELRARVVPLDKPLKRLRADFFTAGISADKLISSTEVFDNLGPLFVV